MSHVEPTRPTGGDASDGAAAHWCTGKVAIVTGASIGIGRAIAEALVVAGASLAVTGRSAERMEQAARRLQGLGGAALGIGMDVTNPADARRTVDQTLARFGRLDFLVNSAGNRWFGRVQDTPLADWDAVLDVQLNGTFLCCQAAIDPLLESGGRIVNLASMYGPLARPEAASYAAAKMGVVALTKVLASELAPTVTVNALAPGTIETERRYGPDVSEEERTLDRTRRAAPIPLQRVGTPEDVVGSAMFLLGPGAAWITGQVIHINGGFFMP